MNSISFKMFKNNTKSTIFAAARSSARSFSQSNEAFWMPFTHQRSFKKNPKILDRAEGAYYYLEDGKEILDGMSGLWCVNAGHGQKKITDAIVNQAGKMDYAPCFNMGHQLPFEFAQKIIELVPNRGFEHVFFTMCGSTAVDTALKIALAYHRAKGNPTKARFIGRERGYHGVGFGGISVGGIVANRKAFASALLPSVDHLAHTHSPEHNAFSRGLPQWGAHLAEDLERIVALHDASTIAAVIVEPVAGSTGVLPPPIGYLKRLREICTKHDILLIFDEVITGFGRVGGSFATEKFDVTPDIITCAKGLTNAAVPAGAVICNGKIYNGFMEAAEKDGPGSTIEMCHGYTYSGHPLAMAAGLATLEVHREQDLYSKADTLGPVLENGVHALKGLPNIVDIRNIGLMAAVEPIGVPGFPMKRTMDIVNRCYEKGVLLRVSGPSISIAPPLICTEKDLDRITSTLGEAIIESSKAF